MTKTDADSLTFSIATVATALGISETGVRRQIADGTFPAIRVGHRVLILKQTVLDLVLRAEGNATIVAEDAEQARLQAIDDKLSAAHAAKVRAEALALKAAHDEARHNVPNNDPQVHYARA